MKGLFIDCGCHDGSSTADFFNWYQLAGDPNDFVAVGFDPNGEFFRAWEKLADEYPIMFHCNAVWIDNCDLDFWIGGTDHVSSTVNADKVDEVHYDKEPVKVRAIDLAEYINGAAQNFDQIIVRMDIEGAEYDVMEHLIKTGAAEKIDILLYERHAQKMRDKAADYLAREKDIVDRLKSKVKKVGVIT